MSRRSMPWILALLFAFLACKAEVVPFDSGVVDPGPNAEIDQPGDTTVEDLGPDGARDDVPPGPCAAGCDDQNPCTDDSCDPVEGCRHVNNALPCDDGDACTVNDTCGEGACKPGVPKDCTDGNPCTDDSCGTGGACAHENNTKPCSDGKDCTDNDVCAAGACAGTPRVCDDGNACTVDGCAEGQGCTNTAAEPGTACNDGNDCTTNDRCQAAVCKGDGKSCDDGNPCTDDTCNAATQECKNLNRVGPCDDGNGCTATDVCTNGVCAGTPLSCDDGNACSTDSCEGGTCRHLFKDCDDDDACTLDTCDAATGDCGHVGKLCLGTVCAPATCAPATGECTTTPRDCNDGNKCTSDWCDLATGDCRHDPYLGACSDGNNCTFGDSCATGTCVGKPCDDGDSCTTDSCDTSSLKATCKYVPLAAGAKCSDGDACTTGDVCKQVKLGLECAGTARNCDDGNACTYDTCDHVKGCLHVAIKGCVNCVLDKECTGGYCVDGICMPKKPLYEACATGTQCESGVCKDPGTGTLVCVRPAGEMEAPCEYGLECRTGVCSPYNTCGCSSDTQCTDLQFCGDSRCIARYPHGAECAADRQCYAGLLCVPGLAGKRCLYDGKLEPGDSCQDPIECTSGVCVVGVCACVDDNECWDKTWCIAGFCVPCCGSKQVCKPCLPPCWDSPTCGCSCGYETISYCEEGCPGA